MYPILRENPHGQERDPVSARKSGLASGWRSLIQKALSWQICLQCEVPVDRCYGLEKGWALPLSSEKLWKTSDDPPAAAETGFVPG